MKAPRTRKTPVVYDPQELEDLILNPAVGRGVGSHLISIPPAPKPSNLSTVDMLNLSTVDTYSLPAAGRVWVTEAGELVPQARVRRIGSLADVLNEAEQAVYDALRTQGAPTAEGDRITEMGYDPLCRQTGLARKTIQRVVAKLVLKDAVAIERPADIYSRRPTQYRIFSPAAALRRMAQRQHTHTAKIGPGFVFVQPGPQTPNTRDLNLSTVDKSKRVS